jgi:hypothetical protein
MGTDLNPGPPEKEVGAIITQLQCLMVILVVISDLLMKVNKELLNKPKTNSVNNMYLLNNMINCLCIYLYFRVSIFCGLLQMWEM